jgi:hypothetical protein
MNGDTGWYYKHEVTHDMKTLQLFWDALSGPKSMMTTSSSSDKVVVSKWAEINEDRKGVKTRVFRVLRTKIHVKFTTVISRNSATENLYNTSLLHSDGPLAVKRFSNSCANKEIVSSGKVTKPENIRCPCFRPVCFMPLCLNVPCQFAPLLNLRSLVFGLTTGCCLRTWTLTEENEPLGAEQN